MKGRSAFGFLVAFVVFAYSAPLWARVFHLTRENFASYLAVSYGPSTMGRNALLGESVATEYSGGSVSAINAGEFGFVYATARMSWRFGFEILRPPSLAGVEAVDSGSTVYVAASEVIAYLPKVGIELNLRTMDSWRVFVFGQFGTGTLSVTNTYSDVTIGPGEDFVVRFKGAATATVGGIGYEFTAFDTTSIVLEGGYRQMTFPKVVYAEDVTDFQGAHAAGDRAVWESGRRREIDFSGAFVTIGARWYLF